MGSTFSPSLANLYMAWWEEHCVFSTSNPFSEAIVWYGRYIDDLLLVWRHSVTPGQQFLEYINSNDLNLRFTGLWDSVSINFLDITLRGDPTTSKVNTSLFRKPNSGITLLRADSCHTFHTVAAVPYGEMIRARRACSDNVEFELEKTLIKKRLSVRGYSPNLLAQAENRINRVTQKDLLQDNCNNNNKISNKCKTNSSLVFSTPYNSDFNKIKNIFFKHLPILKSDDKLSTILEEGVKMVAKKNRTLGNTLSPSLFSTRSQERTWLSEKGFFKCSCARCGMCQYTLKTKTFPVTSISKVFNVSTFLNCNSHHVIYIIYCNQCHQNYVGCTIRPLKARIAEHVYGISKGSIHHSGAVRHFVSCHNSSMATFQVYAIEKVTKPVRGGNWRKKLLMREAFWILRLNTRDPLGMNLRTDLFYIY